MRTDTLRPLPLLTTPASPDLLITFLVSTWRNFALGEDDLSMRFIWIHLFWPRSTDRLRTYSIGFERCDGCWFLGQSGSSRRPDAPSLLLTKLCTIIHTCLQLRSLWSTASSLIIDFSQHRKEAITDIRQFSVRVQVFLRTKSQLPAFQSTVYQGWAISESIQVNRPNIHKSTEVAFSSLSWGFELRIADKWWRQSSWSIMTTDVRRNSEDTKMDTIMAKVWPCKCDRPRRCSTARIGPIWGGVPAHLYVRSKEQSAHRQRQNDDSSQNHNNQSLHSDTHWLLHWHGFKVAKHIRLDTKTPRSRIVGSAPAFVLVVLNSKTTSLIRRRKLHRLRRALPIGLMPPKVNLSHWSLE